MILKMLCWNFFYEARTKKEVSNLAIPMIYRWQSPIQTIKDVKVRGQILTLCILSRSLDPLAVPLDPPKPWVMTTGTLKKFHLKYSKFTIILRGQSSQVLWTLRLRCARCPMHEPRPVRRLRRCLHVSCWKGRYCFLEWEDSLSGETICVQLTKAVCHK